MQKAINSELTRQNLDMNIKVEFIRGGNITSITKMGLKLTGKQSFDACYLFTGVNDLTTPYNKRYSLLNFTNVPSMVEEIVDKLEKACTDLRKNIPNTIICHLIGSSLVDYNKLPNGTMTNDQEIINDAVYHINSAINSMNKDLNIQDPWLSDTVHANINGRHIHKYLRLDDGLHPNEKTITIWAKKLIKSCATVPPSIPINLNLNT